MARQVESAARLFQGAHLSVYGDGDALLGQLAPLVEILGRAVQAAAAGEGSSERA